MAVTKKIIGRIPICFGTWYAKQGGWGIKNRVTLYGSEFESLHENNTVPPAVYDEIENTVAFNENDWRVISNGTEAWLADAKIDALGTWEESPEFVEVCLDKNGRIIYGAQRNGNFIFGAGVPKQIKEYFKEHGGDLIHDIEAFLAGFDGDETLKEYLDENYGTYEEIPEFVEVKLDANGDILWGIKKDGDIVFGCGIPSEIQKALNKITNDINENFGDIRSAFNYISNPEYLFACVDGEGKFLYGVTVEGKFRAADLDFELPEEEAKWINTVFSLFEDPEHRLEATLDGENKVLSWRDSEGVKHEINLAVEHSLELSSEAMTSFQQALKDSGFNPDTHKDARDYHVPEYGSFYIKSETFYLTADKRYSDKTGIYLIQDWADTDENAKRDKDTGEIHESGQPVSLCSYYIKSTLVNNGDGTYSKYNDGVEGHDVQLDFYAANRVSKVGDLYYVTSTLVDGQVVSESIEVTQIIDEPQYKAWPVEKASEHYCLANINFGHYLTKDNVIIGVKYQGQSTMYRRKRNFRITFYKNKAKAYIPADDDKFGKKDKIKIGELVRLSGFNLKANWSDNTRIKELLLYRIILDVWFNRPQDDRFPWDKEFGYYTGATGFINGFPCELKFGGEFFGLDVFALKKDEKNYMLDGDDDHSGIFVCGSHRDATCWKHSYPSYWEDEMMDNMSQETETAIYNFLKFISIMFIGSDDDYYRWHELTYFVDDTPYDFSKVGNKDGKVYLYPEYGGDEITAIYVTSTLVEGVHTENSISCKFVGLDESGVSTMFKAGNNYYRWHDLTYFVGNTSYDYTQVYENNGKICVKSQGSEIIEVTKIYLTSSLVDGAPTKNSIEAEYVGPTNITKKMDVQGFIDYFICMQSFSMWDSICRNMILHTRSDKKKFYPYFYDLDLSMGNAYNADIFDIAYDIIGGQRRTNDMTLWASLLDIYWDEIVNRYSELRKGVLSNDYIKSLYHKATDAIPDSNFNKESAKWGNSGDRTTGDALLNKIIKRLNWLDTDYFKI